MPTATPKVRILWPDVAKGISILGVCFLHVVLLVPGTTGSIATEINRWLGPVRMPLFFIVSGLFAYKVRAFNLMELWNKRLRYLLIPYLVWSPLELISGRIAVGEIPNLRMIIKQVLEGTGSMWFLHSLSVFVVFLWLTRFLPDRLSFAASFLPYLFLTMSLEFDLSKIMLFLPVYCVGVFFRPAVLMWATRINKWYLWLGTFLLFLGVQRLFEEVNWVTSKLVAAGWDVTGPTVHQVLGGIRVFGALPFAILVCSLIAQIPLLARFFTYFGRNTLVIYIGHMIMLAFGFKLIMNQLGIQQQLEDASHLVMWGCIIYGMSLCLFAGWFFERLKYLPVVGKTIDPSLPWSGRPRTRAQSSVVSVG
ncbi:MAG: acyltransferase family protein [Corynebacterium sp.]|nr:acyltransferase family protein [Corynebacterium sp.]